MGHIRRYNPLSWRLRTINLVFGTLLATTLSFLLIFTAPSFAATPPIALLSIPGTTINSADVISAPPDGKNLPTPDRQIGLYAPHSNLTFLYGHSTTAFVDLPSLQLGSQISLYDINTKTTTTYHVTSVTTEPTSAISMPALFERPTRPTLILMTCAGNYLDTTTYDSRLIITATAD